jgi:hypothetical protein
MLSVTEILIQIAVIIVIPNVFELVRTIVISYGMH